MRIIEAFCRNLRHDVDIEEQISEAQRRGIIVSYKLITLTVMNARRDANLCLWCDEIWSDGHLHSCSYAPDHNCMFTCGKDFEVFAFVKVSKEGLKPMSVKGLQDEAQFRCEQKMFDEMCEPKSLISPTVALASNGHHVFDTMSDPENEPNGIKAAELQVFDKMSEPISSSNQLQAPLFEDKIVPKQDINSLQIGVDDVIEPLAEVTTTTNATSLHMSHNLAEPMTSPPVQAAYELDVDVLEAGRPTMIQSRGSSAQKMLDNLPLPAFIREMAQNVDIADESSLISETALLNDGAQGFEDDLYSSYETPVQRDDDLEHRRQMFTKLASLDNSLFQDLVAVSASIERFSTLWNVLIDDSHLSYQNLQNEYKLQDGNSNSGPPFLQVKSPSLVLLVLHGSHSVKLLQHISFDPGINLMKQVNCHYVTLEDKGVLRGEEEKVYVKYTQELFNVIVFWHKWLSNWTNNRSLAFSSYVFDPGDSHRRRNIIWSLVFGQLCVASLIGDQYQPSDDGESSTGGLVRAYGGFTFDCLKNALSCKYIEFDEKAILHWLKKQNGIVVVKVLYAMYDLEGIFWYRWLETTENIKIMIVFDTGGVKMHSYCRNSRFIHIARGIFGQYCHNQRGEDFVFDPGGNVDSLIGSSWHSRAMNYQIIKSRTQVLVPHLLQEYYLHSQDDTIFVFDPGGVNIVSYGGRSTKLAVKWLQSPLHDATWKFLYVSICSNVVAYSILEDKDRFKGSVLIHIIMSWRAVYYFYLFYVLFPKAL